MTRTPRSARLTYWAIHYTAQGTIHDLIEVRGYRRMRRWLRRSGYAGPGYRWRIVLANAPGLRFPQQEPKP